MNTHKNISTILILNLEQIHFDNIKKKSTMKQQTT